MEPSKGDVKKKQTEFSKWNNKLITDSKQNPLKKQTGHKINGTNAASRLSSAKLLTNGSLVVYKAMLFDKPNLSPHKKWQ